MGLFKKAKKVKSPEQLRAESLPGRKKVQYDPINIDSVNDSLRTDVRNLLSFAPLNLQKSSNLWYVQGVFYFDDEYREIFVCFDEYIHEKLKNSSDFFKLDFALMRDAFRKFGQNIQKQ